MNWWLIGGAVVTACAIGTAGAFLLALVWRGEWRAQAVPWRAVLARLPLPMLALAASYGVYEYARLFVPEWVALAQAAAFELTYLGLAVVDVARQERRRAVAISVGAVLASVIYNTLAGLFHRRPELLTDASYQVDAMLAVLHGLPLAFIAYLVSDLLLHRSGAVEAVDVAHLEERATAAEAERASVAQQLRAATTDVAHARQEAEGLRQQCATLVERVAQAEAQVAQGAPEGGAELVSVSGRVISQRKLAQLLDVPESTVRRKLAQVEVAA